MMPETLRQFGSIIREPTKSKMLLMRHALGNRVPMSRIPFDLVKKTIGGKAVLPSAL